VKKNPPKRPPPISDPRLKPLAKEDCDNLQAGLAASRASIRQRPKTNVPETAKEVRDLHLTYAAKRASHNRQEQQAQTMERISIADKKKREGDVGSKVVFKCGDAHHNEEGVRGVVFEKSDKGGIRIVTSHGIIMKNGGDGVFFVPMDFYNVLDMDAVFDDKLEEYQQEILDGTFDESTITQVTMAEAYRKEHNVEGKSANESCQCKLKKSNRCGGTCGCTKRKSPCSKLCGCGGNCKNPYNTSQET
jgi:hypothetical protein